MTSMQLVKDKEGQSYIPPSQRPDGTWRKPIRVRDGYVPQEEQPVYISKGRNSNDKSGLSSDDMNGGGGSFPVGYFDSVELLRKSAGIPGLNFVEDPNLPAVKSKKKKSKSKTEEQAPPPPTTTTKTNANATTSATSSSSQQIDPNKRLRNLKKRLKEIDDLEKRIQSGELTAPEKEQLEKLKRKDEVEEEIEELEKQIADLNFS
jgi:partner of Y14 and mago protein